MFGRAPALLSPALDMPLLTLAAVHCCSLSRPGIRHSAIYMILGFKQVRISVIVPSSWKLSTRIFQNHPAPSRPIPEIRYARQALTLNLLVALLHVHYCFSEYLLRGHRVAVNMTWALFRG